MTNPEYIKQFLIHNKIIFPTNIHDNVMGGFQNYGPFGLKIKNNVINVWRNLFVEQDTNVFEIESPVISPNCVLTRSGHVSKFNDLGIVFYNKNTSQVKDVKRADHFVEDKAQELKLDLIDTMSEEAIRKFMDGNKLYDLENESIDNLDEVLYLRPEIAQTIFVEFKQFLDYSKDKLPFGIAQVGKSFRNEIPDKPFTRLREFTQAEVEFFFNPFESFSFEVPTELTNQEIWILSSHMQTNSQTQIKIKLGKLPDYVQDPIILKYVIKLFEFAKSIGLNMNKIRFRQHKPDERAHYAKDCWDLESDIFGKWLEIAGLAHRGNYDLTVHNKNDLFCIRKNNKGINKFKISPNVKHIWKNWSPDEAKKILSESKPFITDSVDSIDKNLWAVENFVQYEYIVPSVVEPSIGIDRVIYTLVVHNLHLREDGKRPYLLLNSNCQVWNLMLAQLSNHPDLMIRFNEFADKLKSTKLTVFTDLSSTSIGKRYTRADELGIPFTITIDFDTLIDSTVTIRSLEDMSQQRYHIDQAIKLIS
jgi:glycyl-tRNA synthetase